MRKYEVHPAADLFPLMTGEELSGLVADISENGQREPITIWNGKLVDGRNRAAACEQLGIEPDACELDSETDPIKWVLSHNLHRRHLTPSQKAQVAVKLKKLLEPEAKEKQRANGGDRKSQKAKKSNAEKLPQAKRAPDSRTQAASMLGISGKLVDAAEKVEKKGTPELNQAVASGKVSVTKAAKIADAPKEKQSQLIAAPRKTADDKPQLQRLIEATTEKLVVARYLFDSCTEPQRASVSVAWADWWKDE